MTKESLTIDTVNQAPRKSCIPAADSGRHRGRRLRSIIQPAVGIAGIVAALWAVSTAQAQGFNVDSTVALPGVEFGSASWGDYDNDADLDLLLSGATGSGSFARIYRNDSGSFVDTGSGLANVAFSSAAWGDYDRDGDLDLLLTGFGDSGRISQVYRNDAGVFSDIGAGLEGVEQSAVAWGDYDNDGDLDILLTGFGNSGAISLVYANNGGSFSNIGAALDAVYAGSAAWGDYDNDGDLDILLTGFATAGRITRIYRNDGGGFSSIGAGLTGVGQSSGAWGDYDNDGDLDILLTGLSNSGRISRVYRNNGGGIFTDTSAGLVNLYSGAAAWGDSDNDGDLDILITGLANTGRTSRIYRNNSGSFSDTGAGLEDVDSGAAAWGDFDNDGDLDILLCGSGDTGPVTLLYRNNIGSANTPPSGPSNPTVQVIGTTAILSWSASSDAETPSTGLTYNLRIGTTPGGTQIISSMSEPSTGFRRVVQIGNTNHRLTWTITLPALGFYYWSVQAIDPAFAGSISPEQVLMTSFMESGLSVLGVDNGAVDWGDYDNDGDLDFVITGSSDIGRISRIYRNQGGSFIDIGAGLEPVSSSTVAWGDYDRDGDLDVLLAGDSNCCGRISRIYRNDAGAFNVLTDLDGMNLGAVAWADYDNDGDLDLIMSGNFNCCGPYSRVYRNDAGSFNDQGSLNLQGVYFSSLALGDYDNDRDLDVLLAGFTGGTGITYIYRNQGTFFSFATSVEGTHNGSVEWGDYDGDGDPDILLTGQSNCCGNISRVYRNDDASFSDIGAGLSGVEGGSAVWGDYDNDGDRDILLAGGSVTRVYRNSTGSFSDIAAGLEGVNSSAAAWGDHDNDGDLDILVAGAAGSGRIARIYRNNTPTPNAAPGSPVSPSVDVAGTFATFSWAPALDAETTTASLTYNLRVGTSPGGSDVFASMSNPTTGFRQVVRDGNTSHRTSWSVKLPGPRDYYWSVQAVDAGFRGSSFAPEQNFLTSFSDANATLDGVSQSATAWADYDNDGDLDLLLTGYSNSGPIAKVYQNHGGDFADIGAGLVGVYSSSVMWGDYDRDGDVDILLSGHTGGSLVSRIYRNQAGVFTDIGAGLEGVYNSSSAWGDYDNDGDLDVLLAGDSNCCGRISRIYANQGGSFSYVQTLDGMSNGSVAWGDYDNDRDLDILMAGSFNCCGQYTRVYRNNGGSFSDLGQIGLERVEHSSVAWGDYDNDGDLDVLLTGYANCCGAFARVYRNQSGSFMDSNVVLQGIYYSSAAWGDYDNDGDFDVLFAGYSDNGRISRVYENQGSGFVDIGAGLEGVYQGSVVWGDYDNDADLDILVTGDGNSGRTARLYRNNAATANTSPSAPTNPTVSVVVGGSATFSWAPATDAQTLASGLTYNVRVGTSPAASDVMATMANPANGYRRVVQLGNTNHNTSWSIPLSSIPVTSQIYFSVQAIDHSFAGSTFSVEKAFGAMPLITSVADVGNDQGRQVRIQWVRSFLDAPAASPLVTGYAIYRRVDAYKMRVPNKSREAGPLPAAFPSGTWDYLNTVPARGNESYSVVAPTLCDSTSTGACYSVFVVTGLTASPQTYFDSAPDSGFSADNLAPAAPQNLLAQLTAPSRVTVSWDDVGDADFNYYAVYRGLTSGFQPDVSNRLGVVTVPEFDDLALEAGVLYYKVTAVDFAGNEGIPSTTQVTLTTTTAPPVTAYRNALHLNRPNPFNPSTAISFELADAVEVKLVVYDLRGQIVATLIDRALPAGPHSVSWNGRSDRGREVASGEYFYRLTAGTFTSKRKMTLLR